MAFFRGAEDIDHFQGDFQEPLNPIACVDVPDDDTKEDEGVHAAEEGDVLAAASSLVPESDPMYFTYLHESRTEVLTMC